MAIKNWNDAYCQLLAEAFESRGSTPRTDRAQDSGRYHLIADWPRTNGADVLAIASVVDVILQQFPEVPGSLAARLHWQTAIVELAGAFGQPTTEYVHNRSFWSALLAVAAYLETIDAPLPDDQVWDALFAVLWSPAAAHRNGAEGTSRMIIESDVEKMWNKQQAEMIQSRGFDVRETPLGVPGYAMKIPRTTNADAVRLCDYWNTQLQRLNVTVAFGGITNTQNLAGQRERWSAIVRDVDAVARPGKPDEVYPKNHELWREAHTLAVNLAAWGEEPTPFELMVGATGQAVKDLPDTIAHAAGAVSHAVSNIAREVGAGLLSGFGKPLLIGGGVLLGVILLLRSGRSREVERV